MNCDCPLTHPPSACNALFLSINPRIPHTCVSSDTYIQNDQGLLSYYASKRSSMKGSIIKGLRGTVDIFEHAGPMQYTVMDIPDTAKRSHLFTLVSNVDDGRNVQLSAIDEGTKKKWMAALERALRRETAGEAGERGDAGTMVALTPARQTSRKTGVGRKMRIADD